jgi:hypothetical protein
MIKAQCTVNELREMISKSIGAGVNQFRLIHYGKALPANGLLSEIGVDQDNSTANVLLVQLGQ